MMQIAALGSGSSGNSLLIRADKTLLLVDCGFTMKETQSRLQGLGLSLADIDAILISHEHGDHMRGVGPISRKFNMPVWLTHGTYHRTRDNRFASYHLFHAHEPFFIGDIEVDPFPVPHDAAEPCQFVFTHNGTRFANVTDLGVCTPHVRAKLANVHGLVIECNYDSDMLRNGPYPPSLQARIRSEYGHLGNDQAAQLVSQIDHSTLQHVLLGHLSEQNNADAIALAAVQSKLSRDPERACVLAQHCASQWFVVSAAQTASTPAKQTMPLTIDKLQPA
ncbi:MAG: MBL fold metallo-hydrolase [Granulosicoccus sp.]